MVEADVEDEMKSTSSYRVVRRLQDGKYICIAEVGSFEDAQMRLMLLEAEHPGDYFAFNSVSGKRVQGAVTANYLN